jgi:hypothetical protein
MRIQKKVRITLEQFQEYDDAMVGVCISCGATRDCCEPDARDYPCEECGDNNVYGAQELLIMGRVR